MNTRLLRQAPVAVALLVIMVAFGILALVPPVKAQDAAVVSDIVLTSVTETSATFQLTLTGTDGATTNTVYARYRMEGTGLWINAPSTSTNLSTLSLTIVGLTASRNYEFQADTDPDFTYRIRAYQPSTLNNPGPRLWGIGASEYGFAHSGSTYYMQGGNVLFRSNSLAQNSFEFLGSMTLPGSQATDAITWDSANSRLIGGGTSVFVIDPDDLSSVTDLGTLTTNGITAMATDGTNYAAIEKTTMNILTWTTFNAGGAITVANQGRLPNGVTTASSLTYDGEDWLLVDRDTAGFWNMPDITNPGGANLVGAFPSTIHPVQAMTGNSTQLVLLNVSSGGSAHGATFQPNLLAQRIVQFDSGGGPDLKGISVGEVDDATATVTVSLFTPGTTTNTVYIRIRTVGPPAGTWSPTTSSSLAGSTHNFAITSLIQNTEYTVQASLGATFTGNVLATSFETARHQPGLYYIGGSGSNTWWSWDDPQGGITVPVALLGSNISSYAVSGMAIAPDSTVYLSGLTGTSPNTTWRLSTLDDSNGGTTYINQTQPTGLAGTMAAIGFGNNQLYGVGVFSNQFVAYTINTSTGAVSSLGTSSFSSTVPQARPVGMAFAEGIMYVVMRDSGANRSYLATMDLTTGAMSLINDRNMRIGNTLNRTECDRDDKTGGRFSPSMLIGIGDQLFTVTMQLDTTCLPFGLGSTDGYFQNRYHLVYELEDKSFFTAPTLVREYNHGGSNTAISAAFGDFRPSLTVDSLSLTAASATSAVIHVTLAGHGAEAHQVYFRYRTVGSLSWTSLPTQTSIAGNPVLEFTVTGLSAENEYEFQVSTSPIYEARFTSHRSFRTTSQSIISGVLASVSSTGANLTVTLEESAGQPVVYYYRYRVTGTSDWTEGSTTNPGAGVIIGLVGLQSQTGYDYEVSLSAGYADPTTGNFTTTQALGITTSVSTVVVENVQDTSADVVVTVVDRTGEITVFMRYGAFGADAFEPTLNMTGEADTFTFALTGLTVATTYEVQASLLLSFADEDTVITTFGTTGAVPVQPTSSRDALCNRTLGALAGEAALARTGNLTAECPAVYRGDTYYSHTYSFTIGVSSPVTIDATSDTADMYLLLADESGSILDQDDNTGEGDSARMTQNNLAPGTYSIEVTTAVAATRATYIMVFTLGTNICHASLGYLQDGTLTAMRDITSSCQRSGDITFFSAYWTVSIDSTSDVDLTANGTGGLLPRMYIRRGGATLTGSSIGQVDNGSAMGSISIDRLSAGHYTIEIGGNAANQTGNAALSITRVQILNPTPTPQPSPTPLIVRNEDVRLEPSPGTIHYQANTIYAFVLAGP